MRSSLLKRPRTFLRPTDPDAFSYHVSEALSTEEAEAASNDAQLLQECQSCGIDLPSVIENLSLTSGQRLEPTAIALQTLNLFNLLGELSRRKIRYVLIGGLAGRVYGSSYATSDLDICHARDDQNLRKLASLLRSAKAEYRRLPQFGPAIVDSKILATESDFVFTTQLGKLDLIGEFTGVGAYEQAVAGAITVEVERLKVPVLSLPKLMAAKKSTGRSKDQLVHTELEMITKIREKSWAYSSPKWVS